MGRVKRAEAAGVPFMETMRTYVLWRGAEELATDMRSFCPEGKELDVALGKLEEAVTWANAGIARHE